MFLMPILVMAQSPRTYVSNTQAWTDLNITTQTHKKFSFQLEYQYRRQADNELIANGGNNPYKHLQQQLYRPYIHYQANPSVRFSLMPLGWIGTYRFDGTTGGHSKFFSELRITPQVLLSQNIGRVILTHRFRYEFRWLGGDVPANDAVNLPYSGSFATTIYRERFRYQIKAVVPINLAKMEAKTWYAHASNELFVNTGKNVANLNIFDQNRPVIGIGYNLNSNFRFEGGYMNHNVFRFNNDTKTNVDANQSLWLILNINNLETLFKTKK